MRRVMATVVLAMLLATAGCSGKAASSGAAAEPSAPVVLGTSAAIGGSATDSPAPTMGIAANSIPSGAFASIPGSGSISIATGEPTIPRAQAVETAGAAPGVSAAGAKLVSAVYVTLPPKFLDAVLGGAKHATAPRTAWVVTYTNVKQRSHGGALVAGEATSTTQTRLGNTSVIIDATTGEQLLVDEYPTPK